MGNVHTHTGLQVALNGHLVRDQPVAELYVRVSLGSASSQRCRRWRLIIGGPVKIPLPALHFGLADGDFGTSLVWASRGPIFRFLLCVSGPRISIYVVAGYVSQHRYLLLECSNESLNARPVFVTYRVLPVGEVKGTGLSAGWGELWR